MSRSAKLASLLPVARGVMWLDEDGTYPQRFKDACLGVIGVEMPMLHRKTFHIEGKSLFGKERSEMILLRIAAARMPEYKRRIAQTNIMDIDPDRLTPEQLDMIAERLSQKATGEIPKRLRM